MAQERAKKSSKPRAAGAQSVRRTAPGSRRRRTFTSGRVLIASPDKLPAARAAEPGDVAASAPGDGGAGGAGGGGGSGRRGDVALAKQAVSLRLLRAGLAGGVMARRQAVSLASAVAMAGQNVHAVGIGRKVVAGRVTDERAVRVYVLQKLAPSAMAPKDRIPAQVDGVPTDVIESAPAFVTALARPPRRPVRAAARRLIAPAWPQETSIASVEPCTEQRRARQRPLVAGISIAHRGVTAGTLGYFCRSTRHGDSPDALFVLSNNHVLADVNAGLPGDDVYQPSPADGGTVSDHVAELHRLVRITLDGTTPNRVDCAIARLLPGTEVLAEVCGIGAVAGSARGPEQMPVLKHGRTTGLTGGAIVDESYDALVGMDHADPNIVALFENQMRIEVRPPFPAFGLGGDSGSLVVAEDSGAAVGLYFAGPPSGDYGIANHIQDVLRQLEVDLV